MVSLDDPTSYDSAPYESEDGRDCYYAYWEELVDLVKVGGLPDLAEGGVLVDISSASPLATVTEALTATHRYLEQITGKKYTAHIKGFDLESSNGYDSNMVTIQFVVEEK